MSGVGREYGEMEELRDTMREARHDLNDAARERKEQMRERDAEKERLGALMRDKSLNRKKTSKEVGRSSSERGNEGLVDDEGESRIETVEDVTPPRGKTARRTSPDEFGNGMEEFTGFYGMLTKLEARLRRRDLHFRGSVFRLKKATRA